jgi:serine/threonine protein kinase
MLSLKLTREPELSEVLKHHFNPITLHFIYENTASDEHLYTYKLDDTIVKITHDTYASQRLKKELDMYNYLYTVLTNDEMKYFIPNVTGGIFTYGDYTYTYLKMPYITGVDLVTYYQSNPEQKKIYKILKEIATGMLILSKHGVSHGDMHAGNVLISGTTVKIIDFDSSGKDKEIRNRNFSEKRGFFWMCQYFITDPTLKEKITQIRLSYTSDAQKAFEAFITLMGQQGGRRKTVKRFRPRRHQKKPSI